MSYERARAHLAALGLEDRIHIFDESTASVALAAEAVGCECARIAKTLSFMGDNSVILIVTAGDTKVDNKKFKERFSKKAKMLSAEEAESLIGHAVGGVCPFGVNPGVTVYLDISLREYSEVYPAAGSANSAVRLTVEELERASGYSEWVDVSVKR